MKDSEKHLHIVSFDIPFPANYGGAIDVYYRVRYLHNYGVKVHLHCYEYKRNHLHSQELEDICYSVDYYNRQDNVFKMISTLPYIANTRYSERLVDNLLKDDYPILIEGLHSSMLLRDKRLRGRKMYVRMHNIEHEYYDRLSQVEKNWIKRIYLKLEVPRLKRFEQVLHNASGVFAITAKDKAYLDEKGYNNVVFLPSSLQYEAVNSIEGQGTYALFHGQLSVAENYDAVAYLVENVFSKTAITFKVAGLNPPKHLVRLIENYGNVELIANPSHEQMQHLIQNAHVNVLITHQSTGLKLKLLNSLFNGRFCLVNSSMVEGTNLANMCVVADSADDLKENLSELFSRTFTSQDINDRATLLMQQYDNRLICNTLVENIYHK
ncbi:MAG: glycosyltransferase family 1 protein [Bacteroidales bacterium]|nr:glycosyltransferase family 1 protein [Bacteroidales bacterium]